MRKNTNLNNAKREKNDEFYTLYKDIEKELKHYKEHFKNKIVYCNCDNPKKSNFWKYFYDNFNSLELKKLIATYYDPDNNSYKYEYDGANIKTEALNGNGDFRSEECIDILKQSDLIITNPPFSLFREYIGQLIKYEKKFLIIGNLNAFTNKELFPYIRDNKIWLGVNTVKSFEQPDNTLKKIGNINWYTNLDHNKRHNKLVLNRIYTPEEYPKYDNYDAINVNKTKDIPKNYYEVMGVPITFIYKYNPEQFEIIGELNHGCDNIYDLGKPVINGKEYYSRLLIKRKS